MQEAAQWLYRSSGQSYTKTRHAPMESWNTGQTSGVDILQGTKITVHEVNMAYKVTVKHQIRGKSNYG